MGSSSSPSTAEHAKSKRDGSSLYLSGWNPPGARKEWERRSMSAQSARQFLGRWAEGPATTNLAEAVGWFTDDGALRILVCDFDSGRRIVVRCGGRNTKVAMMSWIGSPSTASEPQPQDQQVPQPIREEP